jgi:SMC interacting uncharacterized protein involved in chromosome segregation
MTDELVGLTGTMLEDTSQLSDKVGQVGGHLASLDVQKEELAKQVQTNGAIAGQLDKQLALNIEARDLMQQILSVQGQTSQLTNQVAAEALSATGQVIKTTNQLAGVGETTGELNNSTSALSGRLDALIRELDASADSFRFVGRITKLLNMLPVNVGDTARGVLGTAGKTVQDVVKEPLNVKKQVDNVGKTVNDTVNGVTDTLGKALRRPNDTSQQKEPSANEQKKDNGDKENNNKGLLPGLRLPLLSGSDE